jgi:hypothetical protein
MSWLKGQNKLIEVISFTHNEVLVNIEFACCES